MCDGERSLPRGARSIGEIDSASPIRHLYVWMLRRWLDGVCGQQAVWNAFAAQLGPQGGHAVVAAFEAHMSAVVQNARRRLYRHTATCSCLGSDEAELSVVIDCARRGAETEAYQAAAKFVHGAGLLETIETASWLARLIDPIAEDVLTWLEAQNQQFRHDPLGVELEDAAPLVAPHLHHGLLE